MVKEKIVIVKDVLAESTETGFVNVHWFKQNVSAGTLNVYMNQDNNQWSDMIRNYGMYFPYGLKIKFTPAMYG